MSEESEEVEVIDTKTGRKSIIKQKKAKKPKKKRERVEISSEEN